MKKALISFLMMFVGVSLHAQDKICCWKNNKLISYTIDSTDLTYFKVIMGVDSCTSTILFIPSRYYRASDSIIVRIRKKQLFDGSNNIQTSYCYSVGPHNLALYLDPKLFPISSKSCKDFFYVVDLYYQDYKMWFDF